MKQVTIVLNPQISENDRDAFLQDICNQLDAQGVVILAESLAGAQTVYDLEVCQQFIEDTCNGE